MSTKAKALREVRWLSALNASGEEIPPWAAVKVIEFATLTNVFTIVKPNSNDQEVYFNGPGPISINKYGIITHDWPAYALYDIADGNPLPGENWGAQAGSFKLRKDRDGYIIQGGAISSRILVTRAGGGGGGGTTIDWVRTTSTTKTSRFYPAVLGEYVLPNPGFRDVAPIVNIWVEEANDPGLGLEPLPANKYYMARREAGTFDGGQGPRQVYTIWSGMGETTSGNTANIPDTVTNVVCTGSSLQVAKEKRALHNGIQVRTVP